MTGTRRDRGRGWTGRDARAAACALAWAASVAPTLTLAQDAEGGPSFSADVVPAPDLSFDPRNRRDRTLIFSVLAGVKDEPAYFGAGETVTRPDVRVNLAFFNFDALTLGQRAEIPADPNARRRGFAVGGSLRYLPERRSGDFDELEGLDDVEGSLELGLDVGFAAPVAEAFAGLRYGVFGHQDWVGEVGANLVVRPTDQLTLRAGPRLLYGGDAYAETYFGVTGSEADASAFDAFDADGGVMRTGVEVIASYRFAERWWVEGRARYDRLQNDAADSPITRAGSDEQSTVSIGVRRAFVLDF